MKKLFLIASLIFVNISLNAQSHNIGIKYIGAPKSDEITVISYEYKKNNGYSGVGLTYDFYAKNNFTIGTEVIYNSFKDFSKVASIDENGLEMSPVDYNRLFEYVSIPVKFGYKFNLVKKIFLHPSIGAMPSFLLLAETTIINETFNPIKAYSRFEILRLADLEIGYNLSNNVSITGSYRYQIESKKNRSLVEFKSPMSTSRGNFTVGLNFKLGNKK